MLRAELSWKPEMLHLQQADMPQTDTCSLEMADKRRVRIEMKVNIEQMSVNVNKFIFLECLFQGILFETSRVIINKI